jgi:hydrogenase maturation protein HypF
MEEFTREASTISNLSSPILGVGDLWARSINDTTNPWADRETAEIILVRGLVQGVGFRPTVWRLAQRYGLRGTVANDGDGVVVHALGGAAALDDFVTALQTDLPPLARIDEIVRGPCESVIHADDFRIVESRVTRVTTGVLPDAATCSECAHEVFDPFSRRYRYPFTNCTHCGPRLSIVEAIPYDRARTTMARYALCMSCASEYGEPRDRRFHAEPTACHVCGPRAWIERTDGKAVAVHACTDDVDAVCTLLQRGYIVAIKGLGGFQLACDATHEAAIERLRLLKRRRGKPFALMARDVDVIRRYAEASDQELALLASAAAPIVLLRATGEPLPESVAPGVRTLGFMLPNTPLHHLLLKRMTRPIVLTSGNLSDEPQCIANGDARQRLGGIAEFFLMHDRDIACRVDDSVVAVSAGEARILRRARGYAPAPIHLPAGFETAPSVLGMGGELKNTFCLLRDGKAILSHHMGDLEDARTFADYESSLRRYQALFEFSPALIAVDAHPEYLSSKLGRELADTQGRPLIQVQHHHAHIAACMAENGLPLDSAPILGVALDGLGNGADGTFWGGEFLRADYCDFTRLATFKPVAMPGGELAVYEPWRNTYAHLMAEMGWAHFAMKYAELDLHDFLVKQPRALLDDMIKKGVNSPLASSCGRLFDAVAAACGILRESVSYEGEAAIRLEALVDEKTLEEEDEILSYPFSIPRLNGSNLPYIEPYAMWQALLGDLILKTPMPVIAARFHKGLAIVIVRMVDKLSRYKNVEESIRTVALSGGVFQNAVLMEQVVKRLRALDFTVLTHRRTPTNDGGLALGQAAVAAARTAHSSLILP